MDLELAERMGYDVKVKLRDQAAGWPTPRAEDRQQRNSADSYTALSKNVENWPTPQTSDSGGIVDERAAALSHTPENGERAQLYRRVARAGLWPTPDTGES
ncbi:MAG: hypothetical protein ACREB9_08075, partial [Thermoplasmata archaeon]